MHFLFYVFINVLIFGQQEEQKVEALEQELEGARSDFKVSHSFSFCLCVCLSFCFFLRLLLFFSARFFSFSLSSFFLFSCISFCSITYHSGVSSLSVVSL